MPPAAPLRLVAGPPPATGADEALPAVRLCREFKGLTNADLHRDEAARLLPGQVRSALEHIERGDLEAADRALSAAVAGATVLVFPRPHARRRWLWFALFGGLGVAAGWLSLAWFVNR